MKDRETFYRCHTVPVTSCSEVKYVLKRVSFGGRTAPKNWNWNHFPQNGQTHGFIKGDYPECKLYKMPFSAPDPYSPSNSFLLQVSSLPISIMYQSVLTTHPMLWHGGDIAGQTKHVLTFCIVLLVWVTVGQLIYKGKYGSIK